MRTIEYTQVWADEVVEQLDQSLVEIDMISRYVELIWSYNEEIAWLREQGYPASFTKINEIENQITKWQCRVSIPDHIFTMFALKFGGEDMRFEDIVL